MDRSSTDKNAKYVPIQSTTLQEEGEDDLLKAAGHAIVEVDLYKALTAFKRVSAVVPEVKSQRNRGARLVEFVVQDNGKHLRLQAELIEQSFPMGTFAARLKRLTVSNEERTVAELDFYKSDDSPESLAENRWREPLDASPFSSDDMAEEPKEDGATECYRVYWDGDILVGEEWTTCRVTAHRRGKHPKSHSLFVRIGEIDTGWMDAQASRGRLRLITQLDCDHCSNLFQEVSTCLSPARKSPSVLSNLVRAIRPALLQEHGSFEEAFRALESGPSLENLARELLKTYQHYHANRTNGNYSLEQFERLCSRLLVGPPTCLQLEAWLDVFRPPVEGDLFVICKALARDESQVKILKDYLGKRQLLDASAVMDLLQEITGLNDRAPISSVVHLHIHANARGSGVDGKKLFQVIEEELSFHFPRVFPSTSGQAGPGSDSQELLSTQNEWIFPQDVTTLAQDFWRNR